MEIENTDRLAGECRPLVKANRAWAGELTIPMVSVTTHFDPTSVWRANFYPMEGPAEPRAYLAWQPTNTSQLNFHVPSIFGKLRFAPLTTL